MSDDVVRLSVIGQILRRRWRLLLAVAALGAVVAATASLLWPPAYESSSRVLLLGELDEAMVLSEAQVAMSLMVLDRAAAGLDWGFDGPDLRDSVTAAVVEGNVIEIKAKAGSPDRARQLAERVTQQYIAFSTEILTDSANATGEALAPSRDRLQKQLDDLNLRSSELQGSQDAAARTELQRLLSNRAEVGKALDELDERITNAQAVTSRENFAVIEQAVAPPLPLIPARLQIVAGGAALAAALGTFVLVVIRRADHRLRRGSDIAAALGAPVLGTVEVAAEPAGTSLTNGSPNGHAHRAQPSSQRLQRNGEPWDAPGMTPSHDQSLEFLRYRRVLAKLRGASDEPVRLLVVVVDDDVLACRAVGPLAIAAASDGSPVSVVTSSPQLARTVEAFVASGHSLSAPINVDVSTSANQAQSTQPASMDTVVLSVVTVSAARPTLPDSPDVSGILVVVTSGTRTAWEMLAVAEACHDAGRSVSGALMVWPWGDDADAEDVDPSQLRLSAPVEPPPGSVARGPL